MLVVGFNLGGNLVAGGAMMEGFVFQWPVMLAFLLVVPLLVWLLWHARKQRLKLIDALGGGMHTHRRLRDVLRLVAFMLFVLALARPGHSPQTESVSRSGRDVVFALDVSQSMLAQDMSPSRLEVAKQGIRDALTIFGNERVGLVVYAGSASILCPLTYDYDFVRYMLEQAHPRSVDFGGTTLQSAVEKVVGQVLIEGREGVQDLVVLTDGGDHGSQMDKVIEALEEKQVDVLAVGLGNPHVGSPIPLVGDSGQVEYLESEGVRVTTRLEDSALRSFAQRSPRADYFAVGVDSLDLGQLYLDYSADKQVEAASSEAGVLVYREAAVFFLVPGLLLLVLSECWGARGLQLGHAALWLTLLGIIPNADAADTEFRARFDEAVVLLEAKSFSDAEAEFAVLYGDASERSASSGDLAALQVNRGICLIALSEMQAGENPSVALSYAKSAQLAFLSAKRYAPELQRAGVRLESTAHLLVELQQAIDAEAQEQEQLNSKIDALVEKLENLLQEQHKLRKSCESKDVDRRPRRKVKGQPAPEPIVAPDSAVEDAKGLVVRQGELLDEAKSAEMMMQSIDQLLVAPDMPQMETLITEPLKLIRGAQEAQNRAAEELGAWSSWPAARASQNRVELKIEEILQLLSGDSQQPSDESEDWEDYEEDYDYDYMEDSEESMSSSEAMQGDLAAGAEMQALPIPNYSAEDILMEEQGSLQFRQQKRANANASKVEKDY